MNDPYVKLAKFAVEEFVRTKKTIDVPKNLDEKLLDEKAGVFVSLHKNPKSEVAPPMVNKNEITGKKLSEVAPPKVEEGELRGCIGTFQPTKENIAQEIIDNAISACSQDNRFSPITEDELDDLEISVDVLQKPESLAISDMRLAMEQLDPKKYGVIVKSATDSRTGLLLPDLEGIDTPEYQIAIARQKAGIMPDEEIHLYRFEVIRHKE